MPTVSCSSRSALAAGILLATLVVANPARAADSCGAAANDPPSATAQHLLQALVETNGVPGMGAAVWQAGRVAWTGCAGVGDLETGTPVQRDTVFRLASVSKLIATTAAAKLAEDGALEIDAPVGEALPWLPAAWAAPTVRQLAAHIGGAPHYAEHDSLLLGGVRYPTGRDAAGYFVDRPLLSEPGTAYHYSSWGYTLIGAVIEARAGQHFLDYVGQHITPGLAIGADGDASLGPMASLHDIEGGTARRIPRTDMSYTWGGGGLAATPEALVLFGGRLLEHRIVGADRWQAMQAPVLLADGTPVREREDHVAFGWRVGVDPDGARIAHHAGITAGARSMLMLWPEQGTAVSLLSNASWVSAMPPTVQLLAAAFRAPPAGLVAATCPVAGRLSGTLKEARFEVEPVFRIEQGRCVGEFVAPEALRAHFASAYAWPGNRLRIVALASDGGLSRAALVTPFGLYDLRATGEGRWSATLSGGTVLELAR